MRTLVVAGTAVCVGVLLAGCFAAGSTSQSSVDGSVPAQVQQTPDAGLSQSGSYLPEPESTPEPSRGHERPRQGGPSEAYLASYIGMRSADAVARAAADGWRPRPVMPGEPIDMALHTNRLTFWLDSRGHVAEVRVG